MIAVEPNTGAAEAASRLALPLENGEALHSREFLRRYARMPQVKKAELIEGIVYMGSPVSVRHSKPDALIQGWLVAYASHHPETEVHTNATVILDTENTVQPDALLRLLPEHGGRTRVNEEGYLMGPPELVVEVAGSSSSIDLRDKRRAYCRNGVREYLVWLVSEAHVLWFSLEGDDYRPLAPDADGRLHSQVFHGLRLPVAALLAGETAKLIGSVQRP